MRIETNRRSPRYWQIFMSCALGCAVPIFALATNNGDHDGSAFFSAVPVQGQPISQIFSRTISTRVEGFDWIARRVSGTGTYRLSSASKEYLSFDSRFLYDGNPVLSGITKLRRDGSESCWQDKCGPATDASGLLFNSLIWGTPPKKIGVGTHWHTRILIPWELGPPGEEDVTVTALNIETGSVTLLRKGTGEGSFDSDPAQLKLSAGGKEFLVDMKAGKANWTGYTTIERGIVISDELLVERSLSLSSAEIGAKEGVQRQYILLNKMPQASWEGA
jgi:hypothetical protein